MGWHLDYSNGATLSFPTGFRWAVAIPTHGTLNMLIKGYPSLTTMPQAISMTFKVVSQHPVYRATGDAPGDPAPAFRFYMQRKGDDFSGSGEYQYYRWWSNPVCYRFGSADNSTMTLTVPIRPSQWSSVMGKPGTASPTLFNKAWANGDHMGLTFGGHFFGHGVYLASGQASIYCSKFTLIK